MNQPKPKRKVRASVCILLFFFSFIGATFAFEPIEKLDREKEFSKAIAYLSFFQNDSATFILEALIVDLTFTQELNSPFGLEVQVRLAEALEKDHQDETAIQKLLAVVDASKKEKQWEVLANAYLSLARLYEKLDFEDKCLPHLRLAESIINKHDFGLLQARYFIRISSYHRIFGEVDSAIVYAQNVLVHAPLYNQDSEEAVGHLLLGMLLNKSSSEEAIDHYRKAGNHWKQSGDYSGYAATLSNVSDLYLYLGNLESALAYNDSSLMAATKAAAMGVEKKYLFYTNYKDRAAIYEEMRQPDSALFYIREAYELELYEVNDSSKEKIYEISSRYKDEEQVQKIENQAQLIQYERARKNWIILLFIFALIFSSILAFSYMQLSKANQKTKEQAEELKVLDQVKTKFFGNISHELKTPLSLILGPLSAILDQPEKWDKEVVKKQLLVIQRNGKNLMQIVNEILDLSKLEANKMELTEEATPVHQFFSEIFHAFELQFQNLGINYELNFDFKEDVFLQMDKRKMEKVVNNFLSNALKFTPEKGKITLAISLTESHLKIKASDTGKGIHPEDLPHVFDRFFQSAQADQKQYGGTGIGLAMVKEFAKLMEGDVYVKSEPGLGSHFFFDLPRKNAEAIANVGMAPALINQNTPAPAIDKDFTILVVEDNMDLRQFIYQLLRKNYKKVLLAENGVKGLELLKEHSTDIHLILSDVMMPKMDGMALLNKLKSHQGWRKIPVIMLTALATEGHKLNALTIGVDDYITKPFSVPELQARVQNLLQNYHQRVEWEKTEGSSDSEINPDQPLETQFNDSDKIWIDDLRAIVEDSFNKEKITVTSLANSVFLSSRQLTRRLKSITGLSTAKFIKEVQLQAARIELENGEFDSLSEVAFKFGFEHHATFSTAFKGRFGISPGEYFRVQARSLPTPRSIHQE